MSGRADPRRLQGRRGRPSGRETNMVQPADGERSRPDEGARRSGNDPGPLTRRWRVLALLVVAFGAKALFRCLRRTSALADQIAHLAVLARSDPLTGLPQ